MSEIYSVYIGLFGILLFFICRIILVIKGYGFYFFIHPEELDNYITMIKEEDNKLFKLIFIILGISVIVSLILALIFVIYFTIIDWYFFAKDDFLKLKYEYIIGGVSIGIFYATFPFALLCINNEKLKIRLFLITILTITKEEIENIRKVDSNQIKITTIKSRDILFGSFNVNKLTEKLTKYGFNID